MAELKDLFELLERAVAEPARRLEHVRRFQERVWDEDLEGEPEVVRTIRDLAHDLEGYRPDDPSDDPLSYGDARLLEEIETVLRKCRS